MTTLLLYWRTEAARQEISLVVSFLQVAANASSGRQRGQVTANRRARPNVSLRRGSSPELWRIFRSTRRTARALAEHQRPT